MNYSSEIRSIMKQAYHLGVEIEAYRKDNGRDLEYRRRLVGLKQLEHREDGVWRMQQALYDHAKREIGCDGIGVVSELFDHALYFRLPERRSWIAIVGQPYNTDPAEACERAQRLGLRCYVPPNHLGSWHYPAGPGSSFSRGRRSPACNSCPSNWKAGTSFAAKHDVVDLVVQEDG